MIFADETGDPPLPTATNIPLPSVPVPYVTLLQTAEVIELFPTQVNPSRDVMMNGE